MNNQEMFAIRQAMMAFNNSPDFFDNNKKVNEILKTHSIIGGALALIPLPGAVLPFVLANVYTMYYRINEELKIPLSKNFVKSIGGMLASNFTCYIGSIVGFVACEIIKCIPLFGTAVGFAGECIILFAITGVQGKLYCEWLRNIVAAGAIDKNGNVNEALAKAKMEEILKNKDHIEEMMRKEKAAAKNVDFSKYKSQAADFVKNNKDS